MNVIDTAFEKLDIDEANSDSDDEGESPYKTDPLLEPKVRENEMKTCPVVSKFRYFCKRIIADFYVANRIRTFTDRCRIW